MSDTIEIAVLVCTPDGRQRLETHSVPADYFAGRKEEETDVVDE